MAKKDGYTRKEQKQFTILAPDMLPVHFTLVCQLLAMYGYHVELLKNDGRQVVDEGLKYVHNDTCYPALLVIGQFIDALNSGKYDLQKTALMITQTGGGCRASNYIHLLRKALDKAGYGNIPVFSINLSGLEKGSKLHMSPPMLVKAVYMLLYGDLLMLLKNQVEPYEIQSGAARELVDRWTRKLVEKTRDPRQLTVSAVRKNLCAIVRDFAAIPRENVEKTRVGIVGEIYVKYSAMANNHLEEFLLSQGCEVVVPGVLGFLGYCVDCQISDIQLYGGSRLRRRVLEFALRVIARAEQGMIRAIQQGSDFHAPGTHFETREGLHGMIGLGCKMGEGWLLTAEMIELIERGINNIICAQPFGCLPNHIAGKGTIRALRERFPEANIVPIDYDPGATRVNQENRIKLMLAVSRDKTISKGA